MTAAAQHRTLRALAVSFGRALALACSSALSAQVLPGRPVAPQTPFNPGRLGQWATPQQGAWSQGQPIVQDPVPVPRLPGGLDPAARPWLTAPGEAFRGFPLSALDLSGYGLYPQQVQPIPPLMLDGLLPPAPFVPPPPDWPSWVRGKGEERKYDPQHALLVRQADRVWFREPTEEVAVPLYFWDATRELTSGSAIEVRHAGEFLLLFHGGSRLAAFGPTALELEELAEPGVRLQVAAFTNLRLTIVEGAFTVQLPDGSTLVAEAPAEGEVAGPIRLVLERADEPEPFRGRATIGNVGARAVRWQTAFGEIELLPGRQSTFFFVPPTKPLQQRLSAAQVTTEENGAVRRFAADAEPGSVTFSGARFTVPPGAVLELDPLLGSPFQPRGTVQ